MNCQHCQPLLLDHLYGLLDGPEAAAVDAHLASCPACTAARAETARVQGLFARAAKSAFPNTRFEAPAPAAQPAQPSKGGSHTPAPSTPAVLPFPAPLARPADADRATRRTRTLRIAAIIPWAVAVAVLIAIPGTVVPVLNIFDRARAAHRDAELAHRDADNALATAETAKAGRFRQLDDARIRLTVAEQTQTALLNKWVDEQKAAVQAATARKLNIEVQKPATVQPGAPNDFVVVLRDTREGWESAGKRMVAEVHAVNATDASDAVIFTQPIEHGRTVDNKHPLRLPAAAWTKVKPDAELFLVVAQVDEKTGVQTELQERVRLAGPVFTTLLVTDKAAYRPGERLFFRSLTLDRVTLRPPTREQVLRYELHHSDNRPVSGMNVTGTTDLVRVGGEGKVEPVRTADGQPVRGVGCGEFVLPADLPDGDYTLSLREHLPPGGQPTTLPLPVVRTVKVRAGAGDNYRKQIGFVDRTSYVSGETVEAWAELKFQDKPVAGAVVAGVAVQADGQPLDGVQGSKETDANGRVRVRFALPAEVLNGDVRLKVTFRTPHGDEAVAEQVPVIGNRLAVEFFPECGDVLVAGVPCKVYVRATTPAGQPVDIRGVVTNGREVLARVESLRDPDQPDANRGLASFTYTPQLGTRVWLKLESPAGVYAPILPGAPVPNAAVALMGGPGATATRTGFPLPAPQATGVVMSVLDPITAPGQSIRVQLHSVGRARTLVVGAYTRGRLSDTQKITVEPDLPQIVKLMGGTDPRGGVVRITAFEEVDDKQDLKPVAERLVFRKPGEVLNLAFAATSADPAQAQAFAPKLTTFTAGSAMNLAIRATDEKGNPAAAVLWAAVVNSGAVPGAKDRLMPTHFLLAGEVKNPDDLEYADFLLTGHPKAGEALDLVLGTQGWRRFAEQTPPPAVKGTANQIQNYALNSEAARLLAQNGQYAIWTEPAPIRDHRELFQKYAPRYETAVKAVAQAKSALEATQEETRDVHAIVAATSAAETAKRAADEKAGRAESAREPVRQFRSSVWYGVGGLVALALCCGLVSLTRPSGRFPLGFSTLGSVGLAAFLVIAAGWDDAKASASTGEIAKAPEQATPGSASRRDAPLPPAVAGAVPELASGPADKKGREPEAKMANDNGMGPNFLKPGVKDERPLLPGFPAPVFPGGGFGRAPGAGPPGAAGPIAPGGTPPPIATPAVGAPLAPPPAPGGPGISGGAGWDPFHKNGVSKADLDRSKEALAEVARGKGATAGRAVEQSDKLKRDADLAAQYSAEKAAAMTAAMDLYFAERARRLSAAPKADTKQLERYAVQQLRGAVTPAPPLVVREFAAPRPAALPLADADTPDTLLWQPVIVLPADGKVVLPFQLGSAPGGYQVVVAGHTADGRLGATRGLILVAPAPTTQPFGPALPAGPGAPDAPVPPGPRPMP